MNPLEKDIAESKPQLAPHEHASAPVTALAVDYRDAIATGARSCCTRSRG